jgi:hypothetical protein
MSQHAYPLEKDAVDWTKLLRAGGIQAQRAGLRVMPHLKAFGQGLANLPGGLARAPGTLGDVVLDAAARGGNVLGNAAKKMGVPGATNTLGKNTVQAARNAANKVVGMGTKTTSPFNPINVATGLGAAGLGAAAMRGRGGAQPQQTAQVEIPPPNPQQFGEQIGQQMSLSQRGKALWNGLPMEARWAIGAGVPLALAGGLMGGGGGKALGALGLGAAGLGAATGGLFGEGAQRFMGKQLYNAGTFFGGNASDYGSQIGMLSKLSPQLGATVLMGRDPNLSQQEAMQQYMFLTKNKDMIQRMLPNLTRKTAGELAKMSRCWEGYEPVPGSKPYSQGSCRPKGSKKTQKQMKEKKARSVMFHHETKTLEPVVNKKKPSSEGKHIDVVHHDPSEGDVHNVEGADMPDLKPQAD